MGNYQEISKPPRICAVLSDWLLKPMREAGQNGEISERGIPARTPQRNFRSTALASSIHGHGRVYGKRVILSGPGNARLYGNRVTRASEAHAAANGIVNRHTFNAGGQRKG